MLAAVGGFQEACAGLAVLGVGLELVLDVRDGSGGMTAVKLEWAVAIFAAELGIAVDERVGEGFYLPERFIARTVGTDAAAFYFALVEFLRCNDDFGGHVAFLRADLLAGECCFDSTLLSEIKGWPRTPLPLFDAKS